MRKVLPLLALLFSIGSVHAQTATQSYSNPGSTSIDGVGNYGFGLPPVNFSASDFTDGCIISDVDVVIEWAKTDGTCSSPLGGNSFHAETSFRIDGPLINQILALPGTWSGNQTTFSVVTTFSQGNAIPTGTPVTGTFGPNNGNLNAYNGTSAFGNWNLQAGDNGSGDPLCLTFYSVVVTTTPDNTGPVVSGASNQTLNTSGPCGANATYSLTATDNCGVNGVVSVSPGSGSFFNVGTNPVTYSATDIYGNTTSSSFNITVNDNELPVITCPANISTPAAPGVCVASISYSVPTATDNCSVTVARIAGPASGANFPVGTTTVTHRATDASGNTADCSFTVTIIDNQPPVLAGGCPANQTLGTDANQCGAVFTWTEPTASDNCPGATVVRTGPVPGSLFLIGTTPVSYLVTDASGNTASCSFSVTVSDDDNPVINGCPSIIIANNDNGQCSAVVTWTQPTVTDNCPGAVVNQIAGLPSGSTFPLGTTTITYSALDVAGNSSMCTFNIVVEDTEPPTIFCSSSISGNTDPGQCYRVVTFSPPVFADNCPGVTFTQTTGLLSGSQFAPGMHTISYDAEDAAGNVTNCSFTITVTDNEVPVFLNCPANITQTAEPGQCGAVINYATLLANDNCAGNVTPVMTSTGTASGAIFPVGTTTVTYTATDGDGNVGTCSFTVTITDNEVPQLSCPSDQTVTFDANCQFQLLDYTVAIPALADNCDSSPMVVQSPVAGTTITGSTEVILTATDADGNESSCSFFIIPNDVVAPTITCPGNQSVSVNTICQFTLPNYTGAVVSDDCDSNPTVTQDPAPGSILTAATTVTLTVTDASGNSTDCSFLASPADNIAPTIICPGDQSENFSVNCDLVLPDYTGLGTVSDNCSTPTVTQSPVAGTLVSGQTTVTLTATDGNSNTAACSFDVLPVDVTPPTITCTAGDQTVSFNASCLFNIPDYTSLETASDNCDGNPVITQSPIAGTSIGTTTTVTLTATDDDGNTATCSFDVIPSDNTAPSVSCPADQTVSFDATCGYDLLDYTGLATINDNCDTSPTVTQNPASGTTISTTTVVTITAEDADGNSTSCSFSVIPEDNTDPVISCAGDITVSFDADCEFTLGNYTASASVSDNCPVNASVMQDPAAGTVVSGLTEITLSIVDDNGNTASCTFDVIPDDDVDPTIICPGDQAVDFDANCAFTLADYTAMATVADNCDNNLTVTQSPAFGTVISAATTITLTVTDDAGNSAVCDFDVLPSDNTDPVITSCPLDQNENFTAACNFVLPDYTGLATATDNCDASPAITQFPAVGVTVFGSTVITLTATDAIGNTTTCTFNVLPDDTTPPTISCAGDQNVAFNSACLFNIPDYTGLATVSDNCDTDPVVTQSPVSGTSIGTTTTVTLTATDADGNTNTCFFDVIPSDDTDPTITCPGNLTVSFSANCDYTLLDYVPMATADDNCDNAPSVVQLPAAGTVITATTTVTITVEDAAGNTSNCSFDVIPEDNTDPVITCPGDQTVSFDTDCQSELLDYTTFATVNDNCDASPTVTQSPSAGTTITGLTEVTLTATDASGNISTCAFDVIPEDNEDPVIVCPADQIVSSNPSCQFVIVDYTAVGSVTDNCDASPTVTQSPAFGTIIIIPTTVTLTAEDANGNTATCSFLVTPADNDDPNITCPGDQEEDFDANCEFVLPDYTTLATATDNCSSSPTVTQLPLPGFTITGQTTITLTATDADLNTASCSFEVIPDDNTAPVVSCPGDMMVSFTSLCQFIIPDYAGMATVNDNCDSSPVVTQSPVVGSLVGGPTVITLFATDADGNIGSCTFTITPEDDVNPTLTCPGNQTESFDANCEFELPDYTALVSVFDNCDVPPFTVSQSPNVGTVITGLATVTFSVTDGAGNIGMCSFDVIPDDDIAPTIVCPTDQTPDFDAGCEYTLLDYTTMATASDNCDATPTVTQDPAAGTVITTNTVIELTVTDDAGNTSTCSFNVIPEDNTDPTITCPADQTVSFNGDCEFTLPDYTGLAIIADNCDNTPFIVQSPGFGAVILGATVVTITVTDDAGNTTSCDFNVLPEDDTEPTIICPADQVEDLSATCDFTVPDYTDLVNASDDCDMSLTLTQTPTAGTVISSMTEVNIVAEDDAGNIAACSFDVILEDNTDPTITCPGNETVALSPACLFITPDYTGSATVSDNCDSDPVVTQNPLAGTILGGATVVVLSATDADGNVGTCSFTVTPADITPPTIFDCPADITVDNDAGICGAVVTYATITAIDNCAGVITPQLDAGLTSGSVFPFGATTVTYTANDGNGNIATCTFIVTVNDNDAPVITCPADITLNVESGTCDAEVIYSLPTVTDNCTNPIVPTLEAGLASGSTFSLGLTVVTYQADDTNGNTSTCSFNVTVIDNEAPEITCPANIMVNNDAGVCEAVVNYSLPTVTDNCTSGIVPNLTTGSASGSAFPVGTTTVTYLAEDAGGNTTQCSFTVTVIDNEDPVITCVADFSVNVDPNTCQAVVTYDPPTVADNCTNGIVPVLQSGPVSGSTFSLGVTDITYLAVDANGNESSCTFTVTVSDEQAPTITCPGNQEELFDASCNLVLPDYTGLATAADNCDASPSITQDPVAGTVVNGTTTVILTATDLGGNSSSCSFEIFDSTPPVVLCLGNQTVGADINCEFELLDYTLVTDASDNCGATLLTQDPAPGTLISGQTTVTILAQDGFGNTASCSFDIFPFDNIAPSLTCIGTQPVAFNENCAFELPDYTGQAIAEDNCDPNPIITQNPAVGTVITGPTTITLTAQDADGNSISCNFDIVPVDLTAPTIVCPTTQSVMFDNNCQFVLDDYTAMASTDDNCSTVITVTQNPAAGTVLTSNTVVTLTATDEDDNSTNCAFVVSVADNIDPVITCSGDIDVDFNDNCAYILLDYTELATVTDNCTNVLAVTQSPTAGTVISATTIVTLSTVDGNGNTASCSFNVVPSDNTNPTITCTEDQTVNLNADCQFQLLDYTGLAVTDDNCSSSITITQNPAAGTFITEATEITLAADDGNGNTASCSFTITLEDGIAPTLNCPGNQGGFFSASCGYTLLDYTGNALTAVFDNCDTDVVLTQNPAEGTLIFASTEVTITAQDDAGNTTSCTFLVNPIDNTPPTVTCPTDFNVDFDDNCQYEIPDYKINVLNHDNCGTTNYSQVPIEGTLITASTQVTVTIDDGNGNSSTCSFFVNPSDNTAPILICPGNQFENLDENCQFELPDYGELALVADNCASNMSVAQFPPAGTVIVGETTITLSVEDDNGNSTECSFVVILEDDIDPIMTQCPDDQTIVLSGNCESVIPNLTTLAQATDNCDNDLEYQQFPVAGTTILGVGTHVVQVAAIDDDGNAVVCEVTLTYVDNANPVITCPDDQLLELNANCQYEMPDYTTLATATDGCNSANVTLTQSPPAGSLITTQVNATIIAQDESGNTATCTFFVTPVEMVVTVVGTDVTCQDDSDGTATVSVTGGTPSYTEDWGGFDPNNLAAGNYQVTITDANGCTAIGTVTIEAGAQQQINITPVGPIWICQGELITLNAGTGYADYDWSTGASVQTISVSAEGNYWVQASDGSNCEVNSDTVVVSYYLAVVPSITEDADGVLTSSNDTAQSYQWYLNGTAINGATNYTYCPKESGNYTLVMVDSDGCTVESFNIEFTVNSSASCVVGIDELELRLSIYPNPSTGVFVLTFELPTKEELTWSVFDLLGNRIAENIQQNVSNGTEILDLSDQAEGVYIVWIKIGEDRVYQERLVLVR